MSEPGTQGQWSPPDEATIRARHRWSKVRSVVIGLLIIVSICCFFSTLLGVTQSYLGQWWMHVPRYPGAQQTRRLEGEVCRMYAMSVYCFEWFYRTDASVEEVVDYYEDLSWRFHDPMLFEWRQGRRFNKAWVADDCDRILGDTFCYQIIVRPDPDKDEFTQIYILERSGIGDIQSVRE